MKQLGILILLVVCFCGCREKASQLTAEYGAMEFVAKVVAFHETSFPGVPITNLHQAFANTETPYPERYHVWLSAFGKYAGFTNSFYEKYAFVQPGITNPAVQGEVCFLNSQPFPNPKGELGRLICSRKSKDPQDWSMKWLSETRVAEIFEQSGIAMPKPNRMPPAPQIAGPTTSFSTRVQLYFGDVAGNLGIGRGSWWIVLLVSIAGTVAITSVLVFFAVARRHRGDE